MAIGALSAMRAADEWAEIALQGFRAIALGNRQEAAAHWLRALALAETVPGDLRWAASQSNGGVGRLITGDPRGAALLFDAAGQSWSALDREIDALDPPLVGASSSFHFKLASENVMAFKDARRRRYKELCVASAAITRFNARVASSELTGGSERLGAAALVLADHLAAALGQRAPEVRLLHTVSDDADGTITAAMLVAEKAEALAARSVSMAGALSDACRALEDAFDLTALVVPQMLSPAARLSADGGPDISKRNFE